MPIKDWKREVWTIPNILSLLRLAMIPVYIYVYMNATEPIHYAIAAGILSVSCLTDLIDGKIARKYHMISTLGKILDPIADKATQLSLILCLASSYPQLWIVMGLFLIKEGFQLIAGVINLRQGRMLDGALMAGKVCTVVLFVSLIVLVLLPSLPSMVTNIVIGICCVFMCFSFVEYVRAYYGKDRKVYDLKGSKDDHCQR